VPCLRGDRSRGAPKLPIPSITVKNPGTFSLSAADFHERPHAPGGISERAVIGKTWSWAPTDHPPLCRGLRRVKIGSRVTLYPGVFVGRVSIGDDTVIYPNVSIREGVAIGSRVIIHSAR